MTLFATKGFEGTAMSEIATAVGVRKASIYSHFKSKQEILDTLIFEVFKSMPEKSYLMAKSFDDPVFADEMKDLMISCGR